MKRVFVTCHNPTTQGAISWEGHEIVGYVDVTPIDTTKKKPVVFTGSYYQGWDAIPPELNGTMDVVLSAYCPIASDMSQSTLNGFKVVEKQFGQRKIMSGQAIYDMVVRGFALVKPGGQMVFPALGRESTLTATSREDLEYRLPPPASGDRNPTPNTVETTTSAAFRPTPYYGRREPMAADDREPWLIVTKPLTGGGRRTRTRRTRRKRGTRRR